jgi:hypothetical protein
MIYTTFKQWVRGQFLETGEPRKQAYSKDELALIEMGWGYGYDAGVEAEREACAEIAESKRHAPHFMLTSMPSQNGTAVDIANLIRARGQA